MKLKDHAFTGWALNKVLHSMMDDKSPKEKPGVLEYKFPEVLLRTPRGLIALSGLDVTNNAIHRLVWEEFSSGRRTDKKPILFKNFPADHLYPKCGANVSSDYFCLAGLCTRWPG